MSDKKEGRDMQERIEGLCFTCKHFIPASDPHVQKAFVGSCAKAEFPFHLILERAVSECDFYEQASEEQIALTHKEERAAARAPMPTGKRIEFYYSSQDTPAETFPCDVQHALYLLEQVRRKGIEAEAIDVTTLQSVFIPYHRSVTGPSARLRAVFGMKGALEEDFGRRVPALLIYEGDRYPSQVFPRMDRQQNRIIGVEEALQKLLEEMEAVPAVEEEES